MTRSQGIALRCASAMPRDLLFRRWPGEKNTHLVEVYAINPRRKTLSLLRQLDACKSDEARRLILGRSR